MQQHNPVLQTGRIKMRWGILKDSEQKIAKCGMKCKSSVP